MYTKEDLLNPSFGMILVQPVGRTGSSVAKCCYLFAGNYVIKIILSINYYRHTPEYITVYAYIFLFAPEYKNVYT